MFLIVIFSLMIAVPSYLSAATNEPTFFRKGSSPYGIPYSEWPRIWWQYWVGIPNDEHPSVSYDPTKCSVHQKGPVWFLPDVVARGNNPVTHVDFSCEIPKGKAIYFPLSTASCWLGNPEFKDVVNKFSPDPQVNAQLNTCVISPQDNTQIVYVRVDGQTLNTADIDRATTDFFNMTVPENPVTSIFDFGPPGTSKARADGYFLFLPPLSEGRHQIEFKAVDQLGGGKITREGNYTVFIR
jgi:hypothetical protein